jgi:negative regulator of replication initiation
LLLANAPAALHKLIRDKVVASTLAIVEIRAHGADKALERLLNAAALVQATGKGKVTKKALTKPTSDKITPAQAKQLLQALQSVLHDPLFGNLSPGTVAGVHAALTPLTDLLDAVSAKRHRHPIHTPNESGVYRNCETIKAPITRRTGLSPAEIHLAHVDKDTWIYSTTMRVGNSASSGLPSMRKFTTTHRTRGQAIRSAVRDLTESLSRADKTKAKEAPAVRAWLDKLWTAPDPDWTEEMADAAKEVS